MCDILENISFENITFTESFNKHFQNDEDIDIIKAFSSTWDKTNIKKSIRHSKIYSENSQSLSKNKDTPITNTLINKQICNDSIKNTQINDVQCDLRNWGLPTEIVSKYESKGIKQMFKWQVECLGNSRVLEDYGNLVYSAPTSAGKTLVAEMLTIKTVLERKKKAIIILPFVSVVREKMFYFQDIFSESGIRVEGFMGSHAPPGGIDSIHIAICTIEKANSLVNRLMEVGSISDLGIVVVDELHLLGDPHRGYILELLLTKLIYVTKKLDIKIQIVGMSATLPNLDMLSDWLQADLYKTDFRPIPLEEYCITSGVVYNQSFEKVRELKQSEEILNDKDFIIQLCLETIAVNCSVLIFCPTKNWCENLAQQIATTFRNLGYSKSIYGTILREQLNGENINEVLEQLKSSPVGLDSILAATISFGVAFHHAGLTMDERDIIEGAFKSNALRVLIATSTLSSGVNLPARRVIIRSPLFNSKPINILTYKQMVGRAGRMGIDSAGESILVCSTNEKHTALNLISGSFDPICSCLEGEDRLIRAVLEAIASEIALTNDDIELFTNSTLLFSSAGKDVLEESAKKTTFQLEGFELIRLQKNVEDTYFVATPLGKACLSSSMSPQDGLALFIELQKARECFVLETDLHMIYLVTPYSICVQWGELNWLHYLNLWEHLTPAMKRVGRLIGIQENVIYKNVRNCEKMTSNAIIKKYQIYRRFYTSLALQDLVNEIPLNNVAEKFNCSRGMLQSLQQSAATFAGMVTAFSRQLGWKNFEILVSQFQDRLHFGIQSELLDLMKLQSLNGLRARAIFNAGVETIFHLANSNIHIIENALNSAIPFESEKIRDGEHEHDANKRINMKSIWIAGKKGVTAKLAAELLILEARQYLQIEMGVSEVKWKSSISNSTEINTNQNQSIATPIIAKSTENIFDSSINVATQNETEICDKLSKDEDIFSQDPKVLRMYSSVRANNSVSLLHSTPNNISNSPENLKLNSIMESTDSGNITHDSGNKYPFSDESFDNIEQPVEGGYKNIEKNEFDGIDDKWFTKSINGTNKSNSIFGSEHSKSLSIFDESLIVDTQLGGILDNEKKINSENSCSVKEFGNKDLLSLENEFENTFNTDSILEKSNKHLIPQIKKYTNNKSNTLKRKTSHEHLDDLNNSDNKIFSIQPVIKKRKFHDNLSNDNSVYLLNHDFISIDVTPFLQKSEKDLIISNMNLKLYNCINHKTYKEICCWITNLKKMAVHIDIGENIHNARKKCIGKNILKNKSNKIDVTSGCNKYFIKGISVYSENTSVYINVKYCEEIQLSNDDVINILKLIFCDAKKKIILYDSKTTFLNLFKWYGIMIDSAWEDPLIADWLIDSECTIKPLLKMSDVYCNYNIENILQEFQCKDDLNTEKNIYITSGIMSWNLWNVMKFIKKIFVNKHPEMIDTFDFEMRALKILSNCELSGIKVDRIKAGTTLNLIKSSQRMLEINAYKITGRRFRFSSSSEVAKVMGIFKGRKVKTNKQVLEKIDNPLGEIIIYWRKLNAILTKNLFPLILKSTNDSCDDRIYGSYWIFTSTGRITMQEPNLQNMPRNFEIPSQLLGKEHEYSANSSAYHKNIFCCRSIFVSDANKVYISADYCQLELRLLTHMSKDPTLLKIVSSEEDIFKSIASSWKNIPEEEVDDDIRQKTKQMCYGIIYGMGVKTLAHTLDMNERDAEIFMKTFHNAYPSIKTFINLTIAECKRTGYIETLNGRRRYLPLINSSSFSEKSSAERQAVNTRIQGSAADILKSAMLSIDDNIRRAYSDHSQIKLIILLHDELIYEIPIDEVNLFGSILKECMENAVTLSVPLPVKMKYGKSWGDMNELCL